MRIAFVVASVLATSSLAHAQSVSATARPETKETFAELAAVTGVLAPSGAFIEQRICQIKREPFIGCVHMLYGKQEGGTKKGNVVFDLYASAGMVLRRGRFDVTPTVGLSTLTTTIFFGLLLATPWTRELPDPAVVYSSFPFEVTSNVALGYRFAEKGRFRARAEVAVRGHLPLFTDSTFELPSPQGIGATFGIGAGY
ncbi:MAG TPA: hypothetical protein VIV11_10210 [Kofleriaceae bacterium]